MSLQLSYMEKLTELIRQSPPAPLEEVLRARLTEDHSEVHGIISPSLTRDEPDANLLLYHIYDALDDEPVSREYLRRAVTHLASAALLDPEPGLDYVSALGRLVGYTHVRDSEPLAESLRFQFLGLLEFGLPLPLKDIMKLRGLELARACHLLDIFLAVTPPLWEGEDRHRRLMATFRQAASDIRETPDLEHFRLFLLLFRAMIKLAPEFAGAEALPEMCRVVETVFERVPEKLSTRIRHAWLGTCWEFGVLLNDEEYAHWKKRFVEGLYQQSIAEDRRRPAFAEIFRDSLEELEFDESRGIISSVLEQAEFANLIRLEPVAPIDADAGKQRRRRSRDSKGIYFERAEAFHAEQKATMPMSVQAPQEAYSPNHAYSDRIRRLSEPRPLSATENHPVH
uniref:Uncharacterized protein n=1 Tax=Candidatus Kentrum sp. SD TaxID=2126332 RepID=A0A451BIY3_9GAMM|nr:MAG: hypothetical protein BECKSD772D_GA0070982_101020 [Candidatus Kentron sp. SD]